MPPLSPLESLPHAATTPDAPKNPIESHATRRFIFVTSLLFATRRLLLPALAARRHVLLSMPRRLLDEKGLNHDS
jgi:hypothetical protein